MGEQEEHELESFRKKWISEICQNEQKTDPTIRESVPETGQGREIRQDPQCSKNLNLNERKKKDKLTSARCSQNDYEAFAIANKYLNIVENEQDCKYCSKEQHLTTAEHCRCRTENVRSRKRKRTNSDETKVDKQKRRESLVELLIADIDEITCIPFFDLELPKEIAVKIFAYLTIKDISHCCLVNKQWKAIAEDDLIWYSIFQTLNLNKEGLDVVDRDNWKMFVKKEVLRKRFIQQKWKERFCEVRDLENEKGGILCAADIKNEFIVVAYLDGTIRIWNLLDGSFGHNLKERHTNDEDIITSVCTRIFLSKQLCVASFQNGDVMVWKRDTKLSGRLVYMMNYQSVEIRGINISECDRFICVYSDTRVILFTENQQTESWNWGVYYEHDFLENKILEVGLTSDTLILNNRHKLLTIQLQNKTHVVLDSIAGATFSCIDYTISHVVTAVNAFGYSLLGGFRIRKYCLMTCKELCNITGPQCAVQCLNYRDSLDDQVVVGCSDRKIRIYEMSSSTMLSCTPRVSSDINTLQIDEWKILSGHQDGSISLWDRHNGTMCWQTRMKHPVRICCFSDRLLTIVNIPEEKFPRNSNWYADDLIQHRKYRGSVRVMDFTKDTIHGSLSKEFHADYDNITGYDYNIELIAPYDDVEALNLPKI